MDPIELARSLIACPSVTPADGGALEVLAGQLAALGFAVERLTFGGTPNLFACAGRGSPHLCFAGHTDVVPPGEGWRHPPFAAAIEDGELHGRGACDMKGAIAAFVAAAARHLTRGPLHGSISLLITGDEEGPALDGTVRVLGWMAEHGHIPDFCLVGEPTNPAHLGEMVKVGRRGSLNARIAVAGVQGHVAYPERARNPIPPLLAALGALTAAVLDEGSEAFPPSRLQVTSIDVGNQAANVIPAQASARLNIRFNDAQTGAALTAWLHETVRRHAPDAAIEVAVSGEAFLTRPGPALDLLCGAIARRTGRTPVRDTGGGTSDARFIARHCPVVEFGLVGATMHQVDERVPLADLRALADIYGDFMAAFLGGISGQDG